MSQVKGHSKLRDAEVPHVTPPSLREHTGGPAPRRLPAALRRMVPALVPVVAALVLPTMLLTGLALASGCARRLDLTPAELTRIEGPDGDLKVVRVFPKKKLISLYSEEDAQEKYEVGRRKVTVRGAIRPFKRIIARKTVGRVVTRTEQNGMDLLWVSFDRSCNDTACAYGFVLTELGLYQLMQVPFKEKYETPVNYRRNTFKRNTLKKTKQKSLAEANEVFAVTRKSGKVLTIDLQIRKDTYRPTRADVERAGGAD
jgi:hypothetical protein